MKTAMLWGERRSRGESARVNRHKILEIVHTLAPEDVITQLVAGILGVDSTALSYHVGGKRGFVWLIALD